MGAKGIVLDGVGRTAPHKPHPYRAYSPRWLGAAARGQALSRVLFKHQPITETGRKRAIPGRAHKRAPYPFVRSDFCLQKDLLTIKFFSALKGKELEIFQASKDRLGKSLGKGVRGTLGQKVYTHNND